MTQMNTEHPRHLPTVELTDEGRKISFRKDCFEDVEIMRKVNDEDWQLLIRRVRTPFVDDEQFPKGTSLTYSVKLRQEEKGAYQLDVVI